MLGLRTTIYKVEDLGKAKEWYSKVFQTEPYFDEPFYVGYNIGGYELGLVPNETLEDKSDNVLTYWGVKSIESEFNQLIELGASVHQIPTNVGGDIVVASVKDLWGNVLGIIYNPAFQLNS